MSSRDFFNELENFLPQYVSPIKSYFHAFIAFLFIVAVGQSLSDKLSPKIDLNGDGVESTLEERSRKAIYFGILVIIALVVGDLAYSVSWKLRNRVNRKYLTYARFFPSLFR